MPLLWPIETKADASGGDFAPDVHVQQPIKSQRTAERSTPSGSQYPPPLVQVSVVCREHPALFALRPIVDLIDEFLDETRIWIVADVQGEKVGSLHLLRRIHAREQRNPEISNRFFRDWQFNQAADQAAIYGKVETLKWLTTEYSPESVITKAVPKAAWNGHLNVIKWLYEDYPYVLKDLEELKKAAMNSHLEVVKYLMDNPPVDEDRLQQLSGEQWDEARRRILSNESILRNATPEFAKWLIESGFVQYFEIRYAAYQNEFEKVKLFASHMDAIYPNWVRRVEEENEPFEIEMDFSDDENEDEDEDEDDGRVDVDGEDEFDHDYEHDHDHDHDHNHNHDHDHDYAHEEDANVSGDDSGNSDMDGVGEVMQDDGDDEDGQAEGEDEVPSVQDNCQPSQRLNLDHMIGPAAFKIVKWLHERKFSWLKLDATSHLMDKNAEYFGNLEFIKWLSENRTEGCTVNAMDAAAGVGDLEMVTWLHENLAVGCSTRAMDDAAENGHLEVAKWLHENRAEGCTHRAMTLAAHYGHLDMIKWLHNNTKEGHPKEALLAAGCSGHLEVVKWLCDNRESEITEIAEVEVEDLVMAGHLPVLEYLQPRLRIERCSSDVMDYLAGQGMLEVLQFAHKHGATCTTQAMDSAARNGYLDIVQWLHENRTEGCTTRALDGAIASAHLKVVQFLCEHRQEGGSPHAIDTAFQLDEFGRLELVRWLTANYPNEPFTQCSESPLDLVAGQGDLMTAKWLHETRSEGCSTRAMDGAVQVDRMETVAFLHANRSEGCSSAAFSDAISNDSVEILRWLVYNYPHLFRREKLLQEARESKSLRTQRWLQDGGFLLKATTL